MLKLNKEILEKVKQAKTVEGLLNFSKENNLELTEEEANLYFGEIKQNKSELSDEELKAVAGGFMPHFD